MEENIVLRMHPSLKNSLRLVVLPIILTPALIWVVKSFIWEEMAFWPWMLVFILVGLALPAYAWVVTRFHTYTVRPMTVMSRKGLLSKFTNEIRIPDIRAINVRQNLLQRILRIGDVGFSSAAGDDEEVVFMGVNHPERVKKSVQMQAEEHDDQADENEAGT